MTELAEPLLDMPQPKAAARLAWLFRADLRRRQVHPLLHLMQIHRNAPGVMEHLPPAQPALADPPPHAPIPREDLQRRMAQLPALPAVVHSLMLLLQRDQVHSSDIVDHLGHDQALAARTLRLANSPLYGVSGRVGNLPEAVQVLGFNAVGALLTMSAVQQHLEPAHCPGFSNLGFWKHALAAALLARGLAGLGSTHPQFSEDEAFVGGLLHEVGLLPMATHFPAEMSVALAYARASDRPLNEVEALVTGCDHAQIGETLATHWRFRPSLITAIAQHHQPAPAAWDAPPSLTDVVHAAHVLVHALDLENHPHEQVPPLDLPAWQRLRLTQPALLAVLAQTETGIRQLCQELEL